MAIFSKKPKDRKSKNETPRRSPLNTYYRAEAREGGTSPFSKRLPKRRVRKYLLGFLDIFLLALVIIGIGYSLIIKPQPKVITNSTSFHGLQAYQSAATDQLRHLNNRNKITFNEGALASALQKQFPEITNVQVELPLLSERPTIRLTVAAASFFLNSGGQRYIINSSGRAVAAAGNLPKFTNLPVIEDQSGFKTTTGSHVLSADSVAFINTVIAQCRRAQVPLVSLILPTIPEELDLRTKDQPYFVKFYMSGDVLSETGQFLAARQHFINDSQPPPQYLDVRVAGKVFYK